MRRISHADFLGADRSPKDFRGDTLRLSRRPGAPPFLFATTRGSTPSHKGYLAAFALTPDGLLVDTSSSGTDGSLTPVHLYETPTSGGKANAIELAPYNFSSPDTESDEGLEWLVLTDDEVGYVLILEWSAKRGTFEELTRVQLDGGSLASHAIWLA